MANIHPALILCTVSAVTAQAHAKQEIQINSEKIDKNLVDRIDNLLNSEDPMSSLLSSSAEIDACCSIDNEKIAVDSRLLQLAAGTGGSNDADQQIYTWSNVSGKCYNNCHSSRSWR